MPRDSADGSGAWPKCCSPPCLGCPRLRARGDGCREHWCARSPRSGCDADSGFGALVASRRARTRLRLQPWGQVLANLEVAVDQIHLHKERRVCPLSSRLCRLLSGSHCLHLPRWNCLWMHLGREILVLLEWAEMICVQARSFHPGCGRYLRKAFKDAWALFQQKINPTMPVDPSMEDMDG